MKYTRLHAQATVYWTLQVSFSGYIYSPYSHFGCARENILFTFSKSGCLANVSVKGKCGRSTRHIQQTYLKIRINSISLYFTYFITFHCVIARANRRKENRNIWNFEISPNIIGLDQLYLECAETNINSKYANINRSTITHWQFKNVLSICGTFYLSHTIKIEFRIFVRIHR